ncbi:glutathione S-transferase family protein [Cupriavidus sp. D39]|uniref:glutathione S-transferase family protein n=1 Tax=Cupriavidus sp. D39 TaxID=2997877 RepID=UPI00227092FE|nr:glutathione S-transferase family protein [Cupriavidus sp. D39]MCY0854884.1 glutathione S-transferase family protein [Cupriavidus sp. D39]
MIELYHCARSRSFRPLWMLEELQLPYLLQLLPFPPRVLAKSYLAVNPLGTVPCMIDGAVKMTESSAICQYLAEVHASGRLSVRPDEAAYGRYLNFLSFGEASLTFPIAIFMRYSRLEPEERKLPQAAVDYKRFFLGRLRGVDAIVSSDEYICGDRFTAADISVGYAVQFAAMNGLQDEFPESVTRYLARLKARPGYQRALLVESMAEKHKAENHAAQA